MELLRIIEGIILVAICILVILGIALYPVVVAMTIGR